MTRDEALAILHEYVKSPSLLKHSFQVEACVVAYATKFDENVTKWSVTALLHDFDFEIHPTLDLHPIAGEPILADRGVPSEIRRAILSHADYSGLRRDSLLEKTLYACDELSGFISASALVRPSRTIVDLDTASVRKKMKDKAFARAVNRDDIVNGAAALNVCLEEHIAFCIRAMQDRAAELGLNGNDACNSSIQPR